jgi:urease accessory protein UreE
MTHKSRSRRRRRRRRRKERKATITINGHENLLHDDGMIIIQTYNVMSNNNEG